MKLLLIFLLVCMPMLYATEVTYPNRHTFSNVESSPSIFAGKVIDMVGVLSINGEEAYLCESVDACLSWSPNRFKLDWRKLNEVTGGGMSGYDMCHVLVIGNYIPSEKHDKSYYIGSIGTTNLQISLSISRLDYQKLNPNCAVWNDFIKNRPGDEGRNQLEDMIIRMKYRTR